MKRVLLGFVHDMEGLGAVGVGAVGVGAVGVGAVGVGGVGASLQKLGRGLE